MTIIIAMSIFPIKSFAQGDAAIMMPTMVAQLSSLGTIVTTAMTSLSFIQASAEKVKAVTDVIQHIQLIGYGLQCAANIYNTGLLIADIIEDCKDDFEPQYLSYLLYLSNYMILKTFELTKIMAQYIIPDILEGGDFDRITAIQRDLVVIEGLFAQSTELYSSVKGSTEYYQARKLF